MHTCRRRPVASLSARRSVSSRPLDKLSGSYALREAIWEDAFWLVQRPHFEKRRLASRSLSRRRKRRADDKPEGPLKASVPFRMTPRLRETVQTRFRYRFIYADCFSAKKSLLFETTPVAPGGGGGPHRLQLVRVVRRQRHLSPRERFFLAGKHFADEANVHELLLFCSNR